MTMSPESRARLLKVRDAVIDENGKVRYVTNAKKMYDVLIAPAPCKGSRSLQNRALRRGASSQAKDAARRLE